MSDNKLVVYNATEDLSLARTYAKSGVFAGMNAEQSLVKIHAGRALGIDPVTSLSNIHLVQGKITLGATVVGALIKRSGKYNYRIVQHTNDICELMFLEYFDGKWSEVGPSTFTIEDAKQAGVLNKPVWKNFPRNMLFARALTNGARWFTPDVFGGPVYTSEELDGHQVDDQEMLEQAVNKNLTWSQFVDKAREVLGLEETQVQEILKKRYAEYRKSMSDEMFEYLQSESLVVEGNFSNQEEE